MEEWRLIEGYDAYEVSTLGRVRSWRRAGNPLITKDSMNIKPKLLSNKSSPNSYIRVSLCNVGGKPQSRMVHQLVLQTFVGPAPLGQEVRHKNGDRSDNRLENLQYGTRKENMLDKTEHGTQFKGSTHPNSKLEESDVYMMRLCLRNKVSQSKCAEIFKVTQSNVNAIHNNKTWSHVCLD